MALLNTKLKSFTLIETLVALVIIMLSFGMAMLLFTQVENARKTALKLKMNLAMEAVAQQTKQEGIYLDERMEYPAFYIEKKCYPYEPESNAIVLWLTAQQKNDKLKTEHKEIVCSTLLQN
jgi:type II secretory pathway pseudopilin PulG